MKTNILPIVISLLISFTVSAQHKKNKNELESSNVINSKYKELKKEDDKNKIKSDSLSVIKASISDSIWVVKKIEREKLKKEKDSILQIQLNNDQFTPKLYDKFSQSLYGMSKNKLFTLFRGVDYDFINFKFSSFLQDDIMKLSPTNDYVVKENYISQKYIPKASSKNEYLTVKYNLIPHTDIIGYFESEYGNVVNDKVYLVESVEIAGTSGLVVKLFTTYWNQKISLGGNNKGEIANIQYLNDYISLIKIDNNTAKIRIIKGNMTANYNEIYGINPEK